MGFILGQAEKEGKGGLNGDMVHIIIKIAFIDLQLIILLNKVLNLH